MNRHQVIIIGAGMAGLSAFFKLAECGFKDVLIIEASNRVGGRINTISQCIRFQVNWFLSILNNFILSYWSGNNTIELGAQWIHGRKGNPIYELCKKLHLTDESEGKDVDR